MGEEKLGKEYHKRIETTINEDATSNEMSLHNDLSPHLTLSSTDRVKKAKIENNVASADGVQVMAEHKRDRDGGDVVVAGSGVGDGEFITTGGGKSEAPEKRKKKKLKKDKDGGDMVVSEGRAGDDEANGAGAPLGASSSVVEAGNRHEKKREKWERGKDGGEVEVAGGRIGQDEADNGGGGELGASPGEVKRRKIYWEK